MGEGAKPVEAHWDIVYQTKPRSQFSWFELTPGPSAQMIARARKPSTHHVIDVGGGDSPLASELVDAGIETVTVLDVSAEALARGRAAYGDRDGRIRWLHADVTGGWVTAPAQIWHDRAVFHFLTEARDRRRYVERMKSVLTADGELVVATFAHDGPERCSGLPVMRYTFEELAREFEGFELVESIRHAHSTPAGQLQWFHYVRLARRGL